MNADELRNIHEAYLKVVSNAPSESKAKNKKKSTKPRTRVDECFDAYKSVVESKELNSHKDSGQFNIDDYFSKYKSVVDVKNDPKRDSIEYNTVIPQHTVYEDVVDFSLPQDEYLVEIISDIVSNTEYKSDSEVDPLDPELCESVFNHPINTIKTSDPLTPVSKKFEDIDHLSADYVLFKTRVQAQLSTLGGGGSVLLRELDDVNLNTSVPNDGDTLVYDDTQKKWIPSAAADLGAVDIINSEITTAGTHIVSISENIVYIDNATTVVMPANPVSDESHWISNIHTSDTVINGNGKNIIIDGITYATFPLPPNSTLHLHYNSTKGNWYLI